MKNIGMSIINVFLGCVTLLIVMTVYGRMNHSMELKSNLSSIVEETVEHMTINPKYNIENTNEFLADFVETLSTVIDAESDITVEIFQCDKEKGILAVNVIAAFQHPNGKIGTVECKRTVILNKLRKSVPKVCKVEFWVGDELYKEYTVQADSVINTPFNLQNAGGTFNGWIDENGKEFDFTQPITSDVTYYADIR